MKIIIASMSDSFHREITETVQKVIDGIVVLNLKNCEKLISEIKTKENTILICDKFFLGLKTNTRVSVMKTINPKLQIAILDYGQEQNMYGFRLYQMGCDCFINGIENEQQLCKGLQSFFSCGKFYPPLIQSEIKRGRLEEIKEYLGEISDAEIEVGLKKMMGYTSKEICFDHPGSVDNKYHRFKKKAGLSRQNEIIQLMDYLYKGSVI